MSSASLSQEATSPASTSLVETDRPARSAAGAVAAFIKKLVIAALLGSLVALGARYGLRTWSHTYAVETTDDAYTDSHIVPISSKIAGRVSAVHVTENQQVKKGDLLVELDPADYQLKRAAQLAALSSAKSNTDTALKAMGMVAARLDTARAQQQKAAADVAAAKATSDRAASEYERTRKLLDSHAVSTQDVETTRASAIEASERLKSAQQGVVTANAGEVEAQALVEVAKAFIKGNDDRTEESQVSLKEAEQNLTYTKVLASEDGRITKKSVEPGAYITPGQSLMALVPGNIWVIGNFKETQLHGMRPGQTVDIRIDAYPDRPIRGHVDSIQAGSGARFSLFPPENASGNFVKVVQRVPVKIVFDEVLDPAMVPGPGLSVEPEVRVGHELLDAKVMDVAAIGVGCLVFIALASRRKKAK